MDTLYDDLIKKLGKENLNKVQSMHIGIAGAGGLGSNCAMNLVRAGFNKFTIVDFDEVAASNLDRQFYFLDQVGIKKTEALKANLLRINPVLEIKIINEKINKDNIKSLFKDCEILAECLDKAEYKSMFLESFLGSKKFIVSVSGLGGVGSSDEITTHIINENLVLIGDLHSDIAEKPALSPRVNIAAGKQADVILEVTLKKFEKKLDK